MVGSGALKSAPDAKANDFLFFVKEERKPVNELVWPGIRIIRKDQTKRYIDDGNLHPDFHSHAGPVVAKIREQTLRQLHHAVGLRLAAQEDRLESARQQCQRVHISRARSLELCLTHDAIVPGHETQKWRCCKIGVITNRQRGLYFLSVGISVAADS